MQAQTQSSSARDNTRHQLIMAAEKLFAEAGIDGVSLRQINVAAGQKNSSAAHYHFGSKSALILSIYEQRMQSVNERRVRQLEQAVAAGLQQDVRTLVSVIVLPIVAEIDADTSGGNYIRFMAQAIGHPQLDLVELWKQEHSGGLSEAIRLLYEALPDIPEVLVGQRFGLAFEQIVHALADREKLRTARKTGPFEIDAELFVQNLIDVITGSMSAPVSAQTLQALERLQTG